MTATINGCSCDDHAASYQITEREHTLKKGSQGGKTKDVKCFSDGVSSILGVCRRVPIRACAIRYLPEEKQSSP
ncbi:hypothetical protein D3C84_991840 [compost metagenome]